MDHNPGHAERAVIVRVGHGTFRVMREGFYDYVARFDHLESLLQEEGLIGEGESNDGHPWPAEEEDAGEVVERWAISGSTADAIDQGSRLINRQGIAVGYWEFATLADCQAWLRSSGSRPLE